MGNVSAGTGSVVATGTGGAGITVVVSSVGTLRAAFLGRRGQHHVGAVMVVKFGCKVESMMVATGVGWAGVGIGAPFDFLASLPTLRDALSGEITHVSKSEVLTRACTCVGSRGGSDLSGNGFRRIRRMS